MNLELKSVEYVVFDEADRLFELGFATQLHEILFRLPTNRQTLLFSATLPKSLVEFAKAGLQNPKLVRLDAESKISSDLRMAFFSIKPVEKEAALLCLLRDVLNVPMASEAPVREEQDDGWGDRSKKRRRMNEKSGGQEEMPAHQTLVFAATKHHVEYLTSLMTAAGYGVSAIYGSLDHTARKIQLNAFRAGRTQILCVTDLAARGIDIPILENVVNYDFPVGARTFVHRVGRTARAGRKGWAYSLLTTADLPHLLDLQLFLSRPLLSWTAEQASKASETNYSENLVIGTLPRDTLDQEVEHVRTVLIEPSPTIEALKGVSERGQKMYDRSSAKASAESYRRAKELTATMDRTLLVHPVASGMSSSSSSSASKVADADALLSKIKAFRPAETVFELGTRGKSAGAQLMKERRKTLGKIEATAALRKQVDVVARDAPEAEEDDDEQGEGEAGDMGAAGEQELEVRCLSCLQITGQRLTLAQEVFELPKKGKAKRAAGDYRDPESYLDYAQAGAASDRGYSLNDGNKTFASQAAAAAFSLSADREAARPQTEGDDADLLPQRASALRWDRKTKRVVRGDGVGADNKKLIRSESGKRLPASFQSGRFENWRSQQRLHLPKVGEAELPRAKSFQPQPGRQFRHKAGVPRQEKQSSRGGKGGPPDRKARSSLQRGAKPGAGPGGLRTVDQIAKERRQKEKRVARSTQPSKRGGKASGGRGGSGGGRGGSSARGRGGSSGRGRGGKRR